MFRCFLQVRGVFLLSPWCPLVEISVLPFGRETHRFFRKVSHAWLRHYGLDMFTSLPEFMNFKLFGKTILVANIKLGLFGATPACLGGVGIYIPRRTANGFLRAAKTWRLAKQLDIPCNSLPEFMDFKLFGNTISLGVGSFFFWWLPGKKDPWKEWGSYP